MDILISFIICFILLVLSVLNGIFVGYPLTVALFLFILLAVKKGYKFSSVAAMAYKGGKKSFVVLQIFILIGGITAGWMSCGTVPAIVYYGIKFLNPKLFILSAFLVSCIVSYLIGTSFGTVGTVGVALMVMAKGGGVNPSVAAGAILSGAYFGDRCSPMSSSANLVATLTETDLYINIKNMFKTSALPFIISVVIYFILSINMPINSTGSDISQDIKRVFDINIITLLPAAIILIFSLFKVNVKKLMAASIVVAVIISVIVQGQNLTSVIKYLFMGFQINSSTSLDTIIRGGGIFSMIKVAAVVFISSAFTGIFEGTGMLDTVIRVVNKANNRFEAFFAAIATSTAASAFGCTQALAVILTHLLVHKTYDENGIVGYGLAEDIENTAIVIAPLIPWNIAVLVPLITLGAGFGAIGYSFYLYLIPIANLLFKLRYKKKGGVI